MFNTNDDFINKIIDNKEEQIEQKGLEEQKEQEGLEEKEGSEEPEDPNDKNIIVTDNNEEQEDHIDQKEQKGLEEQKEQEGLEEKEGSEEPEDPDDKNIIVTDNNEEQEDHIDQKEQKGSAEQCTIITKDKINILHDYCKNKKEIVILGSGPTLKTVEPSDDKMIICINNAISVQKECDILMFGDHFVLEESLIPNNEYKNIKFIVVCCPLHKDGPPRSEYNLNYIKSKLPDFQGYYIPFSLKPHNDYIDININYYSHNIHNKLPVAESQIVVTVFLFQYMCNFPNTTTLTNLPDIPFKSINYYGIANDGKLFDENNIYRPYSSLITIPYERKQKLAKLKGHYKNYKPVVEKAMKDILSHFKSVLPYCIN